MSKLDLIGHSSLIYLPEVTSKPIRARIDTGAKTSAISVAKVIVHDNYLEVKFLAHNEAYSDAKTLIFKDFKRVRVISSNSLEERRFKVKLLVVINNRKIRAWFTLTDRSKRTYPVLLGRNVLRGKFLVDVATSHKRLTSRRKGRINAYSNTIQRAS
jgi:hypothetical protein